MQPSISVVIPAYNSEKFIRRTIDSIRGQSFSDFEVIVVENGSSDGTFEAAQKAFEGDARFKVIHLEKGNFSLARNTGSEMARGKTLLFVDADTSLSRNFFKEIHELTLNGAMAGKARLRPTQRWPGLYAITTLLNSLPTRACGNFFINRKLYFELGQTPVQKVGFPDEVLAERVVKKGYKIVLTKGTAVTDMSKFQKEGYARRLVMWLATNREIGRTPRTEKLVKLVPRMPAKFRNRKRKSAM